MENNKITEKQLHMLTYQLRTIRQGLHGEPEDQEEALRLFPDNFIGGVNQVYAEMQEELAQLDKDEASSIIADFIDEKYELGLNQLEHIIK